MEVILASASPRRRELLARSIHPFVVVEPVLDEVPVPGEEAATFARRMAEEKARRVSSDRPAAWTLGADTVVEVDGCVLGKPRHVEEARAMLRRLAGREHRVLTAIAFARGGEVKGASLSRSRVWFRTLGDAEIERYVATGEPLDKAGAYAIQGGAGAFVARVEGSVTGVIGLPLEDLDELRGRLGVPGVSLPLAVEAVPLRLRAVQGEVAALAAASGRAADRVRLVAVSKGQPARLAAAAIAAGATDLGENYVQEGAAKRAALDDPPGVRWHLIGPLQRNKARQAAGAFDLLHAIDRPATAQALARHAGGRPTGAVHGLLQVNLTRDPAKSGVSPEDVARVARELRDIDGFSLDGLMTIGPQEASLDEQRKVFARLRASIDELRAVGYERPMELSMGMSGDFPAAIGEGATLVRIGTAIFGPRRRAAALPAARQGEEGAR